MRILVVLEPETAQTLRSMGIPQFESKTIIKNKCCKFESVRGVTIDQSFTGWRIIGSIDPVLELH